jgi:tetratricopeptide (TPR) repeat protein
MLQKTCFVISPIGQKESDIRKNADDLFDLVLEPALEKYGFKLFRGDKLTTLSSITQDTINHVQNSDLCIIDLTGQNPNVMYECGRRHETGKPFIMIAKEGEELPFDINTIRTIFYDITNGRSIRDAQLSIQKVIDGLVHEGFSPQSSGESLATISDALRRIERKFDSMVSVGSVPTTGNQFSELKELLDKGLTIYESYIFCYRNKRFDLAEAALRELIKNNSSPEERVQYSHWIAEHSIVATKIVEDNILHVTPDFSSYDWSAPINALANSYVIHNAAGEKIKFFNSVIDYFFPHAPDNEKRAELYNCRQKVYYGADLYDEAIEIGLEVIRLWGESSSYHYNLALNYEQKGDMEKALQYIRQCLTLDDTSTAALAKAYKLYKKSNKQKEADEIIARLKSINPIKAEILISMN